MPYQVEMLPALKADILAMIWAAGPAQSEKLLMSGNLSPISASADSFDSLLAAFQQAYADFGKSHLRLVVFAGDPWNRRLLTKAVIKAITRGEYWHQLGPEILISRANGRLFGFALISRFKEKTAIDRYTELAARAGAWMLSTNRMVGKGVVYPWPSTFSAKEKKLQVSRLWCKALYEALHEGTPKNWSWNPFAASIETLHWLEKNSVAKAPAAKPKRLAHRAGVYVITCKANGKVYVGMSTKSVNRRWRSHQSALRKKKHHNYLLQRDWNEYGAASFEWRVLLYCSPGDCDFYEGRCMQAYRCHEWGVGYNGSPGAPIPADFEFIFPTRRGRPAVMNHASRSEEAGCLGMVILVASGVLLVIASHFV